ncbi:hypothetical protein [Microbispora sp. ATCC PTA-5024]|uniref:hypothetical protein n=1 Tax=Microbispora sp. ATCC PTA-5024 TaxID=316330 RepID=UPI0004005311|nr:hypothetical protein [Microbispora sp. ATCC PTA-5024]
MRLGAGAGARVDGTAIGDGSDSASRFTYRTSGDEIGESLELLWGTAAVNTWNARRASVLSWLGWCEEYGYEGPAVPAWTKRVTVPDSKTSATCTSTVIPPSPTSASKVPPR